MYHNIKTRKGLIAVFSVIACAMLFLFAWVVLQQTKKNENYDAWVIHTYEVLRIASRIVNNISEIEASYRGYFLTGSENFLTPVAVLQNGVYADIQRLEKMTVNDAEKVLMTYDFQYLFDRYKNLQEMQRRIYAEIGAPGLVVADIQQSQNLMNKLKINLDKFIASELQNLTRRIDLRKTEQIYHVSTIMTGATIAILGLIISTLVILFLISSSAKTVRRLKDIEELYRVVLESTNDGVYDYDPQNDKVVFSETYESLLGYREDELPVTLQDNQQKLLHPDDYERMNQKLQEYRAGKIKQYTIDYRLRHKNGYWVWVLDRAVGTWNKAGEMIRVIGIHTDITAQKKQEEALRELNAELESFTYIASHDLRSPLVNLKGFTVEIENALETLKSLYHDNLAGAASDVVPKMKKIIYDEIPEALGFIHSSVERMDNLTNAILNLSRIGRRVYKPEQLDMDDLVQRCLDNLQYETNENNVRITAEKMPPLYADSLAIEQIFSNILDNAVKYLDPQRQGEIVISALETQEETIYIIKDNGRGIQRKDQERVFDIFQRARNSGNVRGAGMGLAFVKASVRKMGGRIWFESELDQGTTFYIAFPHHKGGAYVE